MDMLGLLGINPKIIEEAVSGVANEFMSQLAGEFTKLNTRLDKIESLILESKKDERS